MALFAPSFVRCRPSIFVRTALLCRNFNSLAFLRQSHDPRVEDIGRAIEDEYATIRAKYREFCDQRSVWIITDGITKETPKNPIVLAHGLLGFNELHLAGKIFPGIHSWRGITEALTANGIEVITASVPPSASIEERAARLSESIEAKAGGKAVNIVAYDSINFHLLSRIADIPQP
jgi:triacylglycerol lipase